jgi:glycosyltransferase involved in cell wall biosynthesis
MSNMTQVEATVVPKVAIVITAYNAERFIRASVEAALGQTYRNFEVVVVNDGSTDRTDEICRSIQDHRLRYLNRGRLGRVCALNEAIAAVKGEYIAINDADDLSLPQRLDYVMAFYELHPHVAILATDFYKIEEFGCPSPETLGDALAIVDERAIIWPTRATMFRRNLFTNSTVVFPKATWQRIGGYDAQLPNSEDYDFDLRALQCGPAVFLPGRTMLWYTNPNGFFKQKSKREYLQALGFIRRRAHRLLGLPAWLRLYHPVWVVWYELVQRFPYLLELARTMKKTLHKPRLTGPV